MIDQQSLLDALYFAPVDPHDPGQREAIVLPVAPYPGGIPRVAGSDTSIAAAEAMTHRTGPMQAEILRLLGRRQGLNQGFGPGIGLICDEIEAITGWSHQSASARIRELVLAKLVVDSGERRKGRSGRSGRVYRLT